MPPEIDPVTGKPVTPPPPTPDPNVVPKAEFDDLKRRLDAFERTGPRFAAPAAPPPSIGPTVTEQLRTIDAEIDALDLKIDAAVQEGKPVSQLMKQRSTLDRKATRLQIKTEDIDPAFSAGIQTIDQLSETVTRGKMKYYDIVKADVDEFLISLPPEQRMNPKMREAAYNMAVGKNVDKITAAQKEEMLREAANPPAPPPPGNSRSSNAKPGTIPTPKEVLSSGALAAISLKGITVDEYYKKMGYKGGWADFYEKRGKTYFGESEAA